jgi:hypothetical protein
MSRFAKAITLEEFKEICKKRIHVGTDEFDPYEMSETITKDLAKIQFDMENWCIGNADIDFEKYPSDHKGYSNYPCGYEVLENGMPVLFVNAGGDWEWPICFCIYWDGKTLRAYIPKDGNVYNIKQKCAYGSEDDGSEVDEDNLPSGDPAKIRIDVMNRIQLR